MLRLSEPAVVSLSEGKFGSRTGLDVAAMGSWSPAQIGVHASQGRRCHLAGNGSNGRKITV